MLPVGSPEGYCMIEVAADGNPPVQHRLSFSHRASQVSLQNIKNQLFALNISSAYALQLFSKENRYILTSSKRGNIIPLQISLYELTFFLIGVFASSNHNISNNVFFYSTLKPLFLLHKVHKKDMEAMRVKKKVHWQCHLPKAKGLLETIPILLSSNSSYFLVASYTV